MSSSDEIDLNPKIPGVSAASGGVGEVDGVAAGAGVEGVDGVDGVDAVVDSAAIEATTLEANRAIAEGLASGALDPAAAQQLLIDQVLAEQLPPGVAPEQLARLRGEIAALLESDPALANLLRP